jgi:hypothetical protein
MEKSRDMWIYSNFVNYKLYLSLEIYDFPLNDFRATS